MTDFNKTLSVIDIDKSRVSSQDIFKTKLLSFIGTERRRWQVDSSVDAELDCIYALCGRRCLLRCVENICPKRIYPLEYNPTPCIRQHSFLY